MRHSSGHQLVILCHSFGILIYIQVATLLMLQMGYKEGVGTYRWPNGALFRGEWLAGCMHGVGTFESPDSTQYQVTSPAAYIQVSPCLGTSY
jgi:hypothetical protein